MNVVDAVFDLYRPRWGEPSRQAAFRTAGDRIEVCKWDASVNDEGVDLYATLGASAEEMSTADSEAVPQSESSTYRSIAATNSTACID